MNLPLLRRNGSSPSTERANQLRKANDQLRKANDRIAELEHSLEVVKQQRNAWAEGCRQCRDELARRKGAV